MTQILYLGRNDLDHTITFAINGTRYEYFLRSPFDCDRVEYIGRRWQAKGLNLAKRLALKMEKLP